MRCKILHLPTGTYMYRDIFKNNLIYFYSEYELADDNSHTTNVFSSKKEALLYIKKNYITRVITFDDTGICPINYKCHFEIIRA